MRAVAVRALAALLLAALAACGSASHREDPPRIWDTRTGAPVDEAALVARIADARYRLLGEVHDNGATHQARAQVIRDLVARGRRPAVVMEQFDLPHEDALVAAQSGATTPEALADAGQLDRRAWQWPLHAAILAAALAGHLPVHAGNVSAAELRPLFEGGAQAVRAEWQAPLAAGRWSTGQEAALESEIRSSHCDRLPERLVPGFALAQRVRDALMARALEDHATSDGAVLIAGNGHVRHDRGVPVYLPAGESVSVGFVEAVAGESDDALARDERAAFDYVWIVPPVKRQDPCSALRAPVSPDITRGPSSTGGMP